MDEKVKEFPGSAATTAGTSATSGPAPVMSFKLDILPTEEPINTIQNVAAIAQFINKYFGHLLITGKLTAANPISQALANSAAQLEAGAAQFHQMLIQMKQQQNQGAGLLDPTKIPPPQGGQRFN